MTGSAPMAGPFFPLNRAAISYGTSHALTHSPTVFWLQHLLRREKRPKKQKEGRLQNIVISNGNTILFQSQSKQWGLGVQTASNSSANSAQRYVKSPVINNQHYATNINRNSVSKCTMCSWNLRRKKEIRGSLLPLDFRLSQWFHMFFFLVQNS